MKKFCATFLFAISLIFFSQNNFAEAFEVDMGIYPTSGLRAYLITETVQKYEDGFDCTIVYYHRDQPYYLDYYFYQEGNKFYFKSNANENPLELSERAPVEFRIYKYVWLGYR
jgi:hypothetical protein